ncbi:MAG: hypothetical protein DMD36_19785 [Gemmatimonadetes bacterium]|nr:MAG: hypothetical protein DMD36_19785 [Gemmatimonadota bacterium]
MKLALTASVPTFLTVTTTFAVAPCVTAPGALMLEIAMSEASGGERSRRRAAVHVHAEVVQHQVDAIRDRLAGAAGEQQSHRVLVLIV